MMEDAGTQALSDALSSSFRIVKALMALLVVIFLASGMFTVENNQIAVKLRFGRPVGVGEEQRLKPGWHWAFPYPIDEVVKIPVGQSHTITSTVGWYAISPEEEAANVEPQPRVSMTPGVDGYALTADGNIIHVRVNLKYRITDPVRYAFHFASITNLLQHVVDNALLYAASHYHADVALYKDTIGFSEMVLGRVTQIIDDQKLGITLDPSEVRTTAPLDVRPAFDAVLTAQQQGRTRVSDAQAYATSLTNTAVAFARVISNDGVTASNQIVQNVAAEAKSFADQLPSYRTDPALFKKRRLAETLEKVFSNAEEKFFIPARLDGQPRELRLQLNSGPPKPKPEPTAKP